MARFSAKLLDFATLPDFLREHMRADLFYNSAKPFFDVAQYPTGYVAPTGRPEAALGPVYANRWTFVWDPDGGGWRLSGASFPRPRIH